VALPYANGEVDGHFGRTEAFLIVEVGDGRVLSKAVRPVEGLQHDHGGLAGFLKAQGAEVILAGGMGAPMQQALKAAGFALYCGVSGPVDHVLAAFLSGTIEQSEGTCGHHHGDESSDNDRKRG
jgi:predicted Fe-Mo cluster-binding NifX family protein